MQYVVAKAEAARSRSASGAMIGKLLVTGGTGFIGGAVLAELLTSPFWSKTLILARGNDAMSARERIIQSLKRFHPDLPLAALVAESQILVGALDDTSTLASDHRLADVTHVIHAAAVTSFSANPKIRAINVDASLAFVRLLTERAALKRFLNVGTAWCVGMRGAGVVTEEADPVMGEHKVPYTESKIDFERAVRAQFPDLSFVSARPSIVVGHTKLGTSPSGSIYWVFRSGQLMGRFTAGYRDSVDVVPVDWVANALLQLIAKPKLAHDTYHLSAGSKDSSTLGQIDVSIARGRNVEPNGADGYQQVTNPGLSSAVYAMRDRFGDVKPKLLAKALCLYGEFARSGTMFDNSHTLAEGINAPPPFFSYADICAATAETSSIADQMEDDFKC
jgi:nucleoside-diphosphate-sugar epimerase